MYLNIKKQIMYIAVILSMFLLATPTPANSKEINSSNIYEYVPHDYYLGDLCWEYRCKPTSAKKLLGMDYTGFKGLIMPRYYNGPDSSVLFHRTSNLINKVLSLNPSDVMLLDKEKNKVIVPLNNITVINNSSIISVYYNDLPITGSNATRVMNMLVSHIVFQTTNMDTESNLTLILYVKQNRFYKVKCISQSVDKKCISAVLSSVITNKYAVRATCNNNKIGVMICAKTELYEPYNKMLKLYIFLIIISFFLILFNLYVFVYYIKYPDRPSHFNINYCIDYCSGQLICYCCEYSNSQDNEIKAMPLGYINMVYACVAVIILFPVGLGYFKQCPFIYAITGFITGIMLFISTILIAWKYNKSDCFKYDATYNYPPTLPADPPTLPADPLTLPADPPKYDSTSKLHNITTPPSYDDISIHLDMNNQDSEHADV